MSVYTNPPEWEAHGKKPPSSKRTEGWKPGDRVPASWLNWFWFSTVNSLREIAQAFVSHRDDKDNPHSVTKAQVGLGNVDNAKQATKSEFDAHVADKNNPHGVTAEQIGAAPSDATIPAGGIIMWSGSIASIPAGWALCDGRNGTPDLRDRFIVGAGGSYNVGDTGGLKEVALTVAQMPRHNHTSTCSSSGNHSHVASFDGKGGKNRTVLFAEHPGASTWSGQQGSDFFAYRYDIERMPSLETPSISVSNNGAHQHVVTINDAGSGSAHENRPPYYALCFIMKL